jgi:hypothetical protein
MVRAMPARFPGVSIPAFHLFAFREASALIAVLVALAIALNAGGAYVHALSGRRALSKYVWRLPSGKQACVLWLECGNARFDQMWAAEPPVPDRSSLGANFAEVDKRRP